VETEVDTATDPGVEQAEVESEAIEDPELPFEEPETPDEEDEDDAEPAAQAPVGVSIEELEKVRNKLERSATTWRNRVSELLGEEAQFLVPCELCDPIIPGFHFPAELEQPRDPMHERLLDVLREPMGPEFQDDPYTRECTTCGGYGKTRTKGHVPGKTERVCPTCKGVGFQALDAPAPTAGNGQVDEVVYELPSEQPLVDEGNDIWGSPKLLPDGMENPNYGKMPQYKNPTLP
jgi:hypothetical protein